MAVNELLSHVNVRTANIQNSDQQNVGEKNK